MLEDGSTECKREFTEKIVKSLVAFSNTSGGRIVLGIDDDGRTVGLADPYDTAKRCVAAVADKVRPDITMTARVTVDENGGKPLVIIDVREGDKKPYYVREKGLRAEGVYIREGSSSVPVTEERFQQMVMNARSVSFESQISFVQNLTFDYLRGKFEERMLTLTDENMESLRIREGGEYTQLGYILSDQYDQPLKIAAFSDGYRTEFIDRKEFTGCILKQMDEALSFISRFNRTSSVIRGTYREDRKQFSEVSIREAVANAFIHRDYSLDDSILVSVYPTRIDITSPGGLRRPYTLEELKRGVSSLRNRNLAAIFYRLRLIEAYGTGIPRIYGSYDGQAVQPAIETGGSSFTITLPAENLNGDADVMAFLEGRGEFTREEMERELGLNKSGAVSMLNGLIRDGVVVRIGQGRSVRYRLNRPLR